MKTKRLCIISGEILLNLLKKLSTDIPKEAKIVSWHIEDSPLGGGLQMIIESETFPEAEEETKIPNLPFTIFIPEKK